jgi:hypothetical protein
MKKVRIRRKSYPINNRRVTNKRNEGRGVKSLQVLAKGRAAPLTLKNADF